MAVNLNQIQILKAVNNDFEILTNISFSAKRHWNYPEEYMDIWKYELTITSEYIENNIVFKAVLSGTIIGFYSIVENKSDFYAGEVFVKKDFWLEHIFILPEYHKLGLGQMLMEHAKEVSKENNIDYLMIFSDPNAKGFYEKIGAEYLYDSKSSIEGRMIPVFGISIVEQVNHKGR